MSARLTANVQRSSLEDRHPHCQWIFHSGVTGRASFPRSPVFKVFKVRQLGISYHGRGSVGRRAVKLSTKARYLTPDRRSTAETSADTRPLRTDSENVTTKLREKDGKFDSRQSLNSLLLPASSFSTEKISFVDVHTEREETRRTDRYDEGDVSAI